ncbi:MAG: triose-phosphate isomerase [Pseudomonadota bacterium]|nr:triose-phosphate isomerase [Pseudomonadota bacterium]
MVQLIAGNWKMNGLVGDATREAAALAAGIAVAGHVELLICPPATLLAPLAAALKSAGIAGKVGVGGQDCHASASGAHTGDISAAMLADLGCGHVIVGHSERRADHGENDATVKAKAEAALGAGLVAIVCVGETEAEYRAGRTLEVLERQVRGSLPDAATSANTVIAYEPVWAIGTGLTPTSADIAAAHGRIRAVAGLAGVRILYGGSVKPGNAREILAIDGVDGALVGGASLKAADFLGIAAAAPN